MHPRYLLALAAPLLCFTSAQAALILPTANFSCTFGDVNQTSCTTSTAVTQLGEVNGVAGLKFSTLTPLTILPLGTTTKTAQVFFETDTITSAQMPANGQQIPVSFEFDVSTAGDATVSSVSVFFKIFGWDAGQNFALGFGETSFSFTSAGHQAGSGVLTYGGAANARFNVELSVSVRYTGTGSVILSAPNSFVYGVNQGQNPGGSPVPEPATVALTGLGVAAGAGARHWRRRRA